MPKPGLCVGRVRDHDRGTGGDRWRIRDTIVGTGHTMRLRLCARTTLRAKKRQGKRSTWAQCQSVPKIGRPIAWYRAFFTMYSSAPWKHFAVATALRNTMAFPSSFHFAPTGSQLFNLARLPCCCQGFSLSAEATQCDVNVTRSRTLRDAL